MQFAILLFINLILWALFYLVISLKLEKSASEFREKKLRREMDDIIREFNETAERNISLLENRISVLKRLLSRSGAVRTVDVSVGNDGFGTPSSNDSRTGEDENPFYKSGSTESGLYTEKGTLGSEQTFRGGGDSDIQSRRPKDGSEPLSAFMKKVIGRVRELRDSFIGGGKSKNREAETDVPVYTNDGNISVISAGNFPIEKDAREMSALGFSEKEKEPFHVDEDHLTGMFRDTNDKYGLISELYEKGCSMEIMSRCSGMPVGEIRLVLNLNRSVEHESR